MSTTPNQKDLLAKKSDLEGILKPDDNDVLHLPDVTITLAESGQFYLAGIDKKLLTLVGDTSGNAVTLDGDAGLTFTTSGGSSTITGITNSSGNSTSLAASQSMASAKQDKLIAGSNIQIAQDGKTISATDTTYSTFNGASASADGSTGLVPKPFIADKDKYLRGDGTWQTVQATPALNDLTDVDLTTPTDGQILKYDAINQEWINANENPGVTELSGLTDVDVTTTTPTNGQGLVYNSTSEKWENANVLASASVSTLTDVNLTSLKNGQVLKYDTSTQKWVNAEDIDETNEFGPSAPTASMGKDGQIYMQYINPTTITYSTVWTGLALSHYANQPAKVEGFNPSKYYKIRVVGVSYDANVNDEKLVSEIPESSTYSGGWRIGDRMYITTQNNGTELWVYNAPSHPTYPSYITRIDAAQPSEISKVYGKIVNNWIEFPSGSGSSTLASLSDVNITTPTDGQGLVYNNTTQKWENGTVSSASSIDTLTDVNLTNLTNGQILKYNSTSQEWENANESGGSGGGSTFEGLDYANKTSLNIPDATGYTYTPTENGALLLTGYGSASVICESTSELLHLKPYEDTYSTVWVLIEKNVTYTIKKGGGSQSSFGSGSVLYFIPLKNSSSGGGGTGGGLVEDVLWSGSYSPADTSASQLVTLNKNISNYDALIFHIGYSTNYSGDILFLTDNLTIGNYYTGTITDGVYLVAYWKYTSDTSVTLYRYSSNGLMPTYMKITGLKFGSGSSSVTPNPQGIPTDTLSTIEIDGTIYSIKGDSGGGGVSFEEEQLYKASSMSFSDITVDWDWDDYDLYILYSNDVLTQSGESTILTKEKIGDLINNQEQISIYPYGEGGSCLYTPTANQLTASSHTNSFAIIEIVGVKFGNGGGGGSGDTFITYSKSVTTTQYGWWIVEDEDGNTLDPDTYVIIDISVNVRYYDVFWYQDPAGDYRATLFDINDGNTVRSSSTRTWTITYAKKDFSSGGGGGTDVIELTQSEYNALPEEEKNNGCIYMVSSQASTPEELTEAQTNTSTAVTASSYTYDTNLNQYHYPWCAFNRVSPNPNEMAYPTPGVTTQTCWSPNPSQDGSNSWICYHFDRAYKMTSMTINSFTDYSSSATKSMVIEGSNDGTNWTNILLTGNLFSLNSDLHTLTPNNVNLNSDTAHEYVRLRSLEPMGASYQPSVFIDEIFVYGYKSEKALKKIYYMGTEYGNTGGGSSVTPNPTDPATDALTSIEIDGTVYSVGGGDASAEEITLSDYNELTTEEKNDGTIRFIPESSIGVTTPIDMSNPTNISESSRIVITPSEKSVEMTWDTSASTGIGATFYYSRIDVTDYDYLVYDLVTGDSYDSLHPGSENPIRDLGIGLCSSAPSTWNYAPNINWTIWNRYEVTDTNKNLGTQTLDVSELSGEYYLVIAGAAWEATISNLKYAASGGNPSQIKYMDKTYGISSGGSGYTEEVIYSATPTTAAPSTLTLTKPYTDFDMLLFNLYRSADGVMNKYDRVVLTSKLSLNDRIQLITYNEWASYGITTTTSFTLINENSMYIGSVVGLKFGQGSGGGGSSEVNYSTTEHKVGTWIDGSDVYEQTIVLRENGTNNYTYSDSVFSQSLPANINWINIESFYAKRGSGGWVDCMNNQQETVLVPNPATQGIYFYSQMSPTDIIVTIRYTKTI